jgi:filamentous hemagglutinin family protein
MNKQRGALYRNASCIPGIAAMLFATSYMSSLYANPTGAQIVSGTVSVNPPAAGQMTITQKSPKAIVNWNSFSIGANESVNIVQPSATAALLNRVVGNDASVIAGRLQANGNVILVNPAGVIFAQGSSVNVGSMIASTLNIADADFLAGNYHFMQASAAPLSNAGALNAQSGGTIALLGGTVSNTGTVTARLGTVALGAGNDITVDFAGDGLTTLKINQGAANALLGNTGTLAADGGAVIMSAQAADALAGTVINQQGIVRAQSLSEHNGHILLDGGTNGVTQVSGTLDATGGAGLTGGRIDVTGYNVALLDGAHVDASGAAGGGAVRFGGGAGGTDAAIRNANAIWMSPTASIHADAQENGNGGNVVAFSETASRIYGTLSATGGLQGGNGGVIETSGHYLDTTGAKIVASAPKGHGGTWKLDPDNIDIVSAASGVPATETPGGTGSPTVFSAAGTDSQLVNSLIDGLLNQGVSVTVTTAGSSGPQPGDINIQAPISKTFTPPGSSAPTLTLSAVGSIFDTGQNITSTSGPLNLVIDANVGGVASPVNMVSITGATLQTNGGGLTIGSVGSSPVLIQNAVIGTSNGNLSITGTLPANGDEGNTGVAISGTSIATAGGSIALNGTANESNSTGMSISNSTIATTSAPINITGTATAGGFGGNGISITANSLIQSDTGAISLNGAGSSGADGIGTAVSLSGSSVQTTNGAISIIGGVQGDFGAGVDISGGFTSATDTAAEPALSSSGGAISIAGSVAGNAFEGVSVSFAGISNTTGAITISGDVTGTAGSFVGGTSLFHSTLNTGSGDISVSGTVPSIMDQSTGLDVDGSSVQSTGGNIKLTGQSIGPVSPVASVVGLKVENSPCECTAVASSSVTTGTGTLSIYGSGTGTFTQGVLITDGTQITSNNGGAIDIRGTVAGPTGSTPNLQSDYGVLISNGAITTTGSTGTIGIAGSTNTSDPGVAIGLPVPFGGTTEGTLAAPLADPPTDNVTISTTSPGSIALLASNDGTASSLVITQSTLSSPGGVLSIMPASVNSSNFAITAQNATPITLFGTGGGLNIDPETFATFSSIPNIILGSTTQTGLITINGQCVSSGSSCVPARPTFTNNLTLSNPGAGSQGITLPNGISMSGQSLTLISAGPVTDPGGIQAAGLLLSGPGNFTLTDPQNDVGVLAMVGAGNVTFTDSHGFVIGPLVSQTYNSDTGQLNTIDGTNSTLTGNLIATAATGNIGLGGSTPSPSGPNTNLTAAGSIDLVMENGVFVDAGSGTISAGNAWRIWASTWNGETRGNVQPDTAQPNFYGCLFGSGCSWGGTVPTTGNHFVYVARPTVTVTADGATRLAGAPNPTFAFTVSGLINGDTAAGALSGSVSTTANENSLAGQYAIDPNFTSGVGYIVNEVPGVLTVTSIPIPTPIPIPIPIPTPITTPILDPVAKSGLQTFFGNEEQTFVYENNLQGTNICIGSSQPLFTGTPPGDGQDILAVEWKRVRSQPNLNSCLLVNSQHGCGDF